MRQKKTPAYTGNLTEENETTIAKIGKNLRALRKTIIAVRTFEEFSHGKIIETIGTVEHDALFGQRFSQILGRFRLARTRRAGRSASKDHLLSDTFADITVVYGEVVRNMSNRVRDERTA